MHGKDTEFAEALAIQALGHLAQDKEVLERFLSVTGLAPEKIREAAASPGFLAGVLDYMMQNEALLLTFSVNNNIDAEAIMAAHRQLSGPVPQ
ncbi:DUF3572 domain-containing protein [Pararhizobium sp. IMCC21322]|uniref:DUF3572 domain-containing protein n=1 Tax=Pararhizobium sp. IMCC21322 TaxID=3067903 RepID=UPI0027411121|nr:DUF3572 domain-containing protein [Pararhizobium sp. IMCC21322]